MKKHISKIIASALAASAVFSSITASMNAYDIQAPSGWTAPYINEAYSLGIMSDEITHETISKYPSPITREAFCILMYNTAKNIMPMPDIAVVSPFTDTARPEIAFLNLLGIVNGKSETQFAPNDNLTREEAAAILCRAAETAGITLDGAVNDIAFSDDAQISDWARESVYKMLAFGIMQGTDKGFEPKSPYTYEQSITTVVRLYKKAVPSAAAVQTTPTSAPISAPETFTDKLNAQMKVNENYMFSPLSVQTALALLANGADGETKSELLKAASIRDLDAFNEHSQAKSEKYAEADFLQLVSSNSIWINSSRTTSGFSEKYKTLAADFYGAAANAVNNDNAVSEINKWTSEKTNGKIPTIVSDNDFWAMLVNAVYFKGSWQNEFSEQLTAPYEFTNADGSKTTTDFMNRTSWFEYADIDGAKIVRLPYKNRAAKISENGEFIGEDAYPELDIAMYVILSDSRVNPESLIQRAKAAGLFENKYVKLSLPKFKFDFSVNLNDIFKNLGINRAYREDAEFSNMFTTGNMFLTDALHKTYISVDEKGTEAAAVTAIGMAGSSLPPEPIEFKADKPFTFVIYDDADNDTLFAGQFANAK